MPRLMSFAKTVPQFRDGTKDVTRRDGWKHLRPGDVVEAVEWSARVGPRWACTDFTRSNCGWFGSTLEDRPPEGLCPECSSPRITYRKPRRLGLLRIRSARRERLGDIHPEEVSREGFPGESPEWFIRMYCAPGKPDPDREVTRVEFERME